MYQRDQHITGEIPHYRRMLALVTPTRQAATVRFDHCLDLSQTLGWIEEQEGEHAIHFIHVYLAATARLLHHHSRLNRYVTGTRFYQRDGVHITVSAKKSMSDGASLVMLKLDLAADETPASVAEKLAGLLRAPRSGEIIHQEKEYALLLKLPAFVLRPAVRLLNWLDRLHWLPGFFVDPDPMFCSMVVANLGSVGLDVANHHLYEWGNCPFFSVIGRIQDRSLVRDGESVIRPVVDISYTFDERVEDGLACALALASMKRLIEDPRTFDEPLPQRTVPPKSV